ncbi:MAG: cold shock and DUF1294 domain-containing protein [Alphaproteobacteria bacterium]|nr:cold shock and DUF1294 domain-containing protein [Alphaproteobacteria bacterium]
MTRETGELVDWNDERGFGFIRPTDGSSDIYVHIKAMRRGDQRPNVGDRLSFVLAAGKDGRRAAADAAIIGAAATSRKSSAATVELVPTRLVAATSLLILLVANLLLGRLPVWIVFLYLIAGLAAFVFYQADKRAAGDKTSRTPERRLHLLDLAFGIVGGLLAQHFFRHKTHKTEFSVITGLITALHALVLGLVLFGVYAPGSVGDVFRRLSNG